MGLIRARDQNSIHLPVIDYCQGIIADMCGAGIIRNLAGAGRIAIANEM
jgi:hypothetical protein